MIDGSVSRVNEGNCPQFSNLHMKSSGIEGEPKKYDSVIRRTLESSHQSLTFSNNGPTIPKSPKMFLSDPQQPDMHKLGPSSSMKQQNPSKERHTSLYINNALSTESLNIETEPS